MSKLAIDLLNPSSGQRCCLFVDVNDGFLPAGGFQLVKPGQANYEVEVVNPRTNEQRKIFVEMSPHQAAAARSAPCLQTFVQTIARPEIPDGFMPIGNGVRPVTMQWPWM
jgi:hypothetical protein